MDPAVDPVVQVGDRLQVSWPLLDGASTQDFTGRVITVTKTNKVKNGSIYKYEIQFDDGDLQITRLLHLKWNKLTDIRSKKQKRVPGNSCRDKLLPSHNYIVAPMVSTIILIVNCLLISG